MIHLEEKTSANTISSTIILTLDHSKAGNSLGKAEATFLAATLKKHKKSNVIVRSNSTRFFCTGGNLSEQIKTKSKQTSFKTQLALRNMMESLNNHPQMTIALVSGDCFGGGMEFLSSFDYVISAPHAIFGLWQRQLGLSFGWGGGRRLLARSSLQNVKKNVLLARSVCAEEARNNGWVDEIVPLAQLLPRACQLLEQHQSLPQTNFAKLKNWNGEKEEALFSSLWMKLDHQAALKKFSR